MKIMRNILVSIVMFMLFVQVTPAVAKDKIMVVSREKAYVRAEYKSKAEKLFTVLRNFPVKILKKYGSWYQIEDFEGDKGWIYGKTLSSKIDACIVKNNKYANIRAKSNTKSKIVYKADFGVAFQVTKKNGDCLKIKHANGKTGWIHKSLVWGKF
jgi:SH3-like domain-containing protein